MKDRHGVVQLNNIPYNAMSLLDMVDLINEYKVAEHIMVDQHFLKYHSFKASRYNTLASIEHTTKEELINFLNTLETRGGVIFQWYKKATGMIDDKDISNQDYQVYNKHCLDNDVKHGTISASFVTGKRNIGTVNEYDFNGAFLYALLQGRPIRETFKTFNKLVIVPDGYKGINEQGRVVLSGEMAISTFKMEKPDQKIIDYFTKLYNNSKDMSLSGEERAKYKHRIVITIGMMRYKDMLYRQILIDTLNRSMMELAGEVEDVVMCNVDAIYTTVEQDELFDIGTGIGQFKKKVHTNFNINGLNYYSDQSSALRGIPKSQQGKSFEAVRPRYKYNIVKNNGEFEIWQN